MATVQEVLAVRSYEGDAKAGGSFAQGITLDTTPFDKLAAYTVMQNKDLWERDNKKNDAAAKELAAFTALNITSTNPEIRKFLEAKQAKIYSLVENGIPDYQTNPKKRIEYEKEYASFKQDVQVAAQFDILSAAQENKESALKIDDAKKSKNLTKVLIADWLKDGPEAALRNKNMVSFGYDPAYTTVALPKVTSKIKTKSYSILNNANEATVFEMQDERERESKSALANLNGTELKFIGDPNNPIDVAKNELNNTRETNNLATKQNLDNYNKLADEYKTELATYNALPEEQKVNTKPPQVTDFIKATINYNERIKMFNNLEEKEAKKLNNPFVPMELINWENGIDGRELIQVTSFTEDQKGYSYEKTLDQTDTGTKNRAITENIKDNKSKNALEWYKAKAVNYGTKGNTIADKITEQGYNPIASIIASIGKVNTAVPLSSLSIAQVAALNPSYLTSDGTLTADAEKKNVSFGTNADGKYAIFELGENGKGKVAMSETKILSNASSYLSRSGPTGAAERKGQDAYSFTQNGFLDAIGSTAEKNNKKENSDNSAQKKWHFDSNYNVVYDK